MNSASVHALCHHVSMCTHIQRTTERVDTPHSIEQRCVYPAVQAAGRSHRSKYTKPMLPGLRATPLAFEAFMCASEPVVAGSECLHGPWTVGVMKRSALCRPIG